MARDWNQTFSSWSAGPSDTEENKISNTLKQIRAAIHNDPKLKTKDTKVFVQGSYKNNVNVKLDSDVDVGVLSGESFHIESSDEELSRKVNSKYSRATYQYPEFKNDLENALKTYFGTSKVTRGNKAFDVHESSTRVDADVVALIEYRWYTTEINYINGVMLYPDNSNLPNVINWPDQHYTNGVDKNNATGRRYKRVVRIMKKLRNEMVENGYPYLENVPGYLIECLIWNTPNTILIKSDNYYETIKNVIFYLFNELDKNDNYKEWGEVDEVKYLFRATQPWKKNDAQRFIRDAWNYVGYGK
ncbi:MAG: nucleotidyltransferase [Candidatus Delongbacteria bacterium]|nr:nucleotidyltransferase [Candidatus Delongbacteria bacterium]